MIKPFEFFKSIEPHVLGMLIYNIQESSDSSQKELRKFIKLARNYLELNRHLNPDIIIEVGRRLLNKAYGEKDVKFDDIRSLQYLPGHPKFKVPGHSE